MKKYDVEVQTFYGQLVVEVEAGDDADDDELLELALSEAEASLWASKLSQVYGR